MAISKIHFIADVTKATVYSFRIFRGETVDLSASLVGADGQKIMLPSSSSPVDFYWQADGMPADEWYATTGTVSDGVLRAVLLPTMFDSRERYRFFFSVEEAGEICYRANGVIMVAASPGPVPGQIDFPPPPEIDFDFVTIKNAPWLLPSQIVAGTENVTIETRPDGTVAISVVGGGSGSGISPEIAQALLDDVASAKTIKSLQAALSTFARSFLPPPSRKARK